MTKINNVRFASLAAIVGVSFIVLSFALVAFASEFGEDGGGGWDSGSYDLSAWDSGSYDLSGWDSGSYDLSGWDSGSYDLSEWDSGSYDLSAWDSGSYDLSPYDDFDEFDDYVYEDGVAYSERSYSSPSYSQPSYSQPFSFRAPSTSYAPSYPRYQAPAPQRP